MLSDVACMKQNDFIRFVDMIRQAHAHTSDGITLRSRLDQLMSGALGDTNFHKKRSFYPMKIRLTHLFTEVLATDGEVNEAYDLLHVRSTDPALASSSTLSVLQIVLLCLKTVLYVHAHPDATSPVKIPTLADFSSNLFTFANVITALKTKQSKAFLRQNIGWKNTAAQLVRDLQMAFASSAGRVGSCLAYESLRVAFYTAVDQSAQVYLYMNICINFLKDY